MASSATQAMVPATPQTKAALGLPSNWLSSSGDPPLLDLSFLTEEEKEKIQHVLQADQELKTRDRIRLGTMRQDIQQERTHQRAVADNQHQCTCCEKQFGRFFNTGANCPQCSYRVCKRCRKVPYTQPPSFVCNVCAKQKLLDLQSKDYVPTPTHTPDTTRKEEPVQPSSNENSDEDLSPLYGSELVLKSLHSSDRRSSSPKPVPYRYPRPSCTSSSSVSSSIVVRYENRSGSESSTSSSSSVTHPRKALKLPLSSVARKVSANELLPSDDEDDDVTEQKKAVGVPVIDYLKRSDSMGSLGSMTSVYSAAGGKGDYEITGDVCISVWHKNNQLFVRVVKARGLAAAKKGVTSDPYVKTYLLPDRSKHTKRKTSVQRKTVNPLFNEILKNKLPQNEVSSHTLWLSVWDWDRFGRNQFLGEVRLTLSTLDLTDPTEHWYSLQDKDESVNDDDFYKGKLRLSLKLEPSIDYRGKKRKGVASLHIRVHQAQELPKMNPLGLTDATVKFYLLPNRSSAGKRKTQVVKNNLNPVWEEEFKYEFLTVKELASERVLEVTVWDFDRRGSNDFIGGLRLGPAPGHSAKHKEWMDSIGEEVTHWEAVLARPGEWVEVWHTLRPTMHPLTKHGSPSSLRKTGLSPVKELSPTQESEVDQSAPAIVEGFAFTPPTSPQHHPVTSSQAHTATPPPPHTPPKEANHDESTNKSSKITPPCSPPPTVTPAQAHRVTPSPPPTVTPSPPSTVRPSPPPTVTPPLSKKETPVSSRETTPIPEVIISSETVLKREDYYGSQASVYSAAGGKGDYDIAGEVLFGVHYKGGQLLVHVNKARGLAAADSNGFSDPYIKTYLLPDKSKHSKKKTAIKKKTVNPVYNETLKYKVASSEVDSRTLWLSVWDWDRFGRNQFLGEVRLTLSTLDLTDPTDHWYSLQDKDESPSPEADSTYCGELRLGLKYDHTSTNKGTLHVYVKQAKDLPMMDPSSLTSAYVKSLLLPPSKRTTSGKKKTGVVNNSLNPVWDESFTYEEVTLEELSHERVLEMTIWSHDKSGNDLIGGLRLGPAPSRSAKHKEWMDSIGEEVTHWEAVLARPGEWVEVWHTLRTTMDYRQIDLSTSSLPFQSEFETESPSSQTSPSPPPSDNEVKVQRPRISFPSLVPKLSPERSPSPEPPTKQPDHPPSIPVDERQTSVEPVAQPDHPPSIPVDNSHTSVEPVAHSTPLISIGELSHSGHYLDSRVEEEEPRPKVISPLQRSGLLGLKSADSVSSFGSQASVYSAAGGKGDYDIAGEVLFGVHYKGGQLLVHVNKARGLAAADSNGFSDPYIKTYLLPDKSKHSKKKTAIKRKTLNPVYNETLKYKVASSDVDSRTLWLSVWDWDRFGRNQFLGEVRLTLSTLDLTDPTEHWYSLQDKDEGGDGATYHGQLQLSMMFSPIEKSKSKSKKTKGTLNLALRQAKDLPHMQSSGTTDAFVKCYLLPDKSSSGKRKTGVVKNNLNPVWGTTFSYEKTSLEELSTERVLEIVVWDFNKGGSSEFVGGLRLGSAPGHSAKHKEWMDSIGEEVTHWEAVLARPGEWVEVWHTLRTTMDYRSVSLD